MRMRRFQRVLTGAVFGLVAPVFGYALYLQLARVITLSGRPFWFLCGALVTGIFYLLVPRSLFWMVWVHESTHAFVAWLLGARLEGLEANIRRGGVVHYRFEKDVWGQEFVSLAPYFVQPVSLLACGVLTLAAPWAHWWLSLLAGAGVGYFYFDMIYTLSVPQTDITKTGTGYSTLIILGMHILWTGTVLCVIFPETTVPGFWVDGPAQVWMRVAAVW